jgi:hypothetical protein
VEGYSITDAIVTANSLPIELIDGKYTLENITKDMTVNVEGVVAKKLKIKFKYTSGVKFTDVKDAEFSVLENYLVDYGDYFNFKTVLISSYNQSLDNMKVYDDENNLIVPNRGVYTLPNVEKKH